MERRDFLAAAIASAGALAAEPAFACTPYPRLKPMPFDHKASMGKIRKFIQFANVAYDKSDPEIDAWIDRYGIKPQFITDSRSDEDLSLKSLRISDGKVDPLPIRIGNIKLLKQRRNKATYVFTLKRKEYYAADPDNCFGGYDEGYENTEKAYLATFENNNFQNFRRFREWEL